MAGSENILLHFRKWIVLKNLDSSFDGVESLETPWQDLSLIAFDTETTGKYPVSDELCEIAAVKWEGGQIVDCFQTLIKPQQKMGQEVINIHHITNEMVESAPAISEKIIEFAKFIDGGILVAHHSPFDLGFLALEFEKVGLPLPQEPVLCSSLLSRKVIHETPNHKMQTLVKVLGLDGGEAHRALDDTKACLQLTLKCLERIGVDKTFQDVLNTQKTLLFWKQFSINELKQRPGFENLIHATEGRSSVQICYEGGSRKGEYREVIPCGLVRTPKGDFLVANDKKNTPAKRYFLDKISGVKLS